VTAEQRATTRQSERGRNGERKIRRETETRRERDSERETRRERLGERERERDRETRESDSLRERMPQCATAEQRAPLVITVEDAQAREVTYRIVGAAGGQGVCAPANASACNISLAEPHEGIYILEILVGGEQVRPPVAARAYWSSPPFTRVTQE
jgi:hypothetical protein